MDISMESDKTDEELLENPFGIKNWLKNPGTYVGALLVVTGLFCYENIPAMIGLLLAGINTFIVVSWEQIAAGYKNLYILQKRSNRSIESTYL